VYTAAVESCDPLPAPETTVVNVQLGDVMDSGPHDCFKVPCTYPSNNHAYIYPRKYYKQLVKQGKIRPSSETNIEIVGFAYHTNIDIEREKVRKSLKYMRDMRSFFESCCGYNVSIRGANEPDRDFVYMSKVKRFAVGGGGFSRVINKMVQLGGDTK